MIDKLAMHLLESKNWYAGVESPEESLYELRVLSYILAVLGGICAVIGFADLSWTFMVFGIVVLVFGYSFFSVLSRCSRILEERNADTNDM